MFHVIDNPTAGKKGHAKNLQTLERVFKENGVEYMIHTTTHKGGGKEIVEKLTADGGKDIVVVGGDGTVHEVLNGMKDPTACRLGIIPSGTGNDFVYSAKIPMDAEEAAMLIVKGETKPTDYIEVGERRCMNICGAGMDVDVLERCERGKGRGKLKYFKSLLGSLFVFKGCKVLVERDGKTEERSALISAVCNGKVFGGGIKLCMPAEIDDGKMHVVLVDCIGGKIKLIKALLQLMKGKITEYPATTVFTCERVKFSFEKETPFQLDGEIYRDGVFDAKLCTGLQIFR